MSVIGKMRIGEVEENNGEVGQARGNKGRGSEKKLKEET